MSWLSEMIGGGNDNSALLEQQRLQDQQRREDEARAREEQKAAELKASNIERRNAATGVARTGAQSYLSGLGLDPNEFQGDIDSKINEALAYTAEDDPNIGQYIHDLGRTVYDTRESAARNKAGRDIDLSFGPDFESGRISDTLDDSTLNSVNTEQRGKADEYINNLIKRGVITQSGQAAANKSLDDQGSRVRTILNELGRSSLESGRSALSGIANRGRQAASTLRLGNTFDPNTYTSDADRSFNEFVSGLGDSIRSKVPTDLYDTSNLASIAGAGQGAQNLKFDPNALAGIKTDEEELEEDQNKRITF